MEFHLNVKHPQAELVEHLKGAEAIFVHSKYCHATYPTNSSLSRNSDAAFRGPLSL